MSLLDRYLTREILKCFCIVFTLVIGLFIAVDYLSNLDEFLESGISFFRAFHFVLLKIPFMMMMFIPVGMLMAVLVVFGLMRKNNETVALKASGVSIYYLLRPVLFLSVVFGFLNLLLSEIIVPITMSEANRIKKIEIRKDSTLTSSEKNIWIKGNRRITHVKYFNPVEKTVFGITLNEFDEAFRLARRIDALKGIYREEKWVLMDVIEQTLKKDTGTYQVAFHDERSEQLDFLPEDLKRLIKKSEEMSFSELYAYIRRVEAEGYDAGIYRVDLYAKTAFPVVCIIMGLVGVGIASMEKIIKGLPVSIALGIGTAFLYWVFYSFCLSLGYGEMLPPLIAAWTANFVFMCFSLITLQYAD